MSGPPFVGAPVRPNMLKMPESASDRACESASCVCLSVCLSSWAICCAIFSSAAKCSSLEEGRVSHLPARIGSHFIRQSAGAIISRHRPWHAVSGVGYGPDTRPVYVTSADIVDPSIVRRFVWMDKKRRETARRAVSVKTVLIVAQMFVELHLISPALGEWPPGSSKVIGNGTNI